LGGGEPLAPALDASKAASIAAPPEPLRNARPQALVFLVGMKAAGGQKRISIGSLNRGLDLLLFWLGCLVLGTGLLLAFRLGHGPHWGDPPEALGLDPRGWAELHQWVALAFAGLVAAHLALHWRWIARALSAAPAKLGWWAALVGAALALLPLVLP